MKPTSKLLPAALFLAHFLFVSDLFWAAGIHSQAQAAFVGAPLSVGILTLPFLARAWAQSLVFVLGLLCALGFVRALLGAPRSQRLVCFLGILLGEAYFIALDLRLWSRFTQLLLFLTLVYLFESFGRKSQCGLDSEEEFQGLRLAFLAVPLSGPWPLLLTSLLLPLYLPRLGYRPLFCWLAVFSQALQGHLAHDVDFSLLSCLLIAVLLSGRQRWALDRTSLALLLLSLWVGAACHNPVPDLRLEVRFKDQGQPHLLVVIRERAKVSLKADGETLTGAWFLGEGLVCNPYFFSSYPQALDSERIIQNYLTQLRRRCAVEESEYRIFRLQGDASGLGN